MKLTNISIDNLPTTFEEWCEIHGEPEYETKAKSGIDIEDCTPPTEEIDPSGIIYEDKKGRKQIDYARFLDVFTQLNPIVYVGGVFYSPRGAVPKDILRQDIHFSLVDNGWTSRLDIPVNSLYDSLKNHCALEKLIVDDKVLPLTNGDLHIDGDRWVFHLSEFKHCAYRLNVAYTPVSEPTPLFDKWLADVFAPEDIPCVQEILGYCLVPVTAAQEAFILVGDAGVGKSGFGAILKELLGNAFVSMETQQLVTGRFQIATVENKLVAYDDDLGSAALTETGLLKKLITADVPIQGERKYSDPHEFISYCRIIASANFMLSSLYDDSDGFFRRLHPIHVKPKNPDRRNINRFYEMMLAQEKQQIFRWALEGLRRVIANGWKISWSERSRNYLAGVKSNAVHFQEFLDETCDFGAGDASNAEIKKTYHSWCKENGITPSSDRRLYKWLADNAERLRIFSSRCLKRGAKYVRGYTNITIKSEWNASRINIDSKLTF